MSGIKIRPAGVADLSAITAVYADAVLHSTATFELVPPDLAEITARFHKITGAGFPYVVAEAGGEIAGYAYAGSYHARAAFCFTVENSIYIKPQWHRRGVGAQLLARLIGDCESAGFRQIVAVIGDSGNAGSIGLHRSAGFQMVGTLRNAGLKFGRWLDTVTMQLAINGGGDTIPGGPKPPGLRG